MKENLETRSGRHSTALTNSKRNRKNGEQRMSKNYKSKIPSVYQELGFTNPDKWEAKADLAIQINKLIETRSLTQAKAAEILGISRPRVSDLKRGQLDKFSMEKLLMFLTALDQDVDIVIHPKTSDSAYIRVRNMKKRPVYAG